MCRLPQVYGANMKRIFISFGILIGVMLMFSSCDHPSAIELVDERIAEPWEVVFLKENGDTTLVTETSVDLTGLTKEDENRFPGTILVTEVVSDLENHTSSLSYARILLEDRSAPFNVSGRFGSYTAYPRIDIGKAALDKSEFELAEWILKIRSLTLILVRTGVFYKLGSDGVTSGKPFTFKHDHDYSLEVEGKGAVKSFGMQIETPGRLSLRGISTRSLILRDEDLYIHWSGKAGPLVQIIFSTYDVTRARADKPLMMLKANPRGKSVVVSSKLLRLLPKNETGKYLVSVVSANRSLAKLDGYSEDVLVQAATIQNVLVTIR